MNYIKLVNKENPLKKDYTPTGLVEITDFVESSVIKGNMKIHYKAYQAFKEMQESALKENHKIFINSCFRSYKEQTDILCYFINKIGYDEAIKRVALPGCSEHQTGLAIDFAILESIDDNGKHYVKGEDMWEDEASKWVYENCHKFGFILRYPKGKFGFTNQDAEPWHIRYVGVMDATIMKEKNLTLEEYYNLKNIKHNKFKSEIPVIGVVGRVIRSDQGHEVISTGEYYRKCLNRNNAAVFTIQPPQDIIYNDYSPKDVPRLKQSEKDILDFALQRLDGIILPGGSKWYEFDEYICKYALEHNIPLLGICLGMQTMAYIDNLSARTPKFKTYLNEESDIDHYQIGPDYVHAVNIKPTSPLGKLLKQQTIMVNSRHNYNIGELTNEFTVYGYSPDGIPEYMTNGKSATAVQWHPEIMAEYDLNNKLLIEAFVNTCRGE